MPRADEERILREWTPVILRSILLVASMLLLAGLLAMATRSPGYYVGRFRAVQNGTALHVRQDWLKQFQLAFHGDPHAVATFGLTVLTLVTLGRVEFTFFLFL